MSMLIMSEPKVGQIFAIYGRQLTTVGVEIQYVNVKKRLGRKFYYNETNDEVELKNRVLFLKYLGNGLCEEYYTSKLVHLALSEIDCNDPLTIYDENSVSFMQKFNEVIKSPLAVVPLYDGEWNVNIIGAEIFEETDYYKKKFGKNVGHEVEIIETIEMIEVNGIRKLRAAMPDIITEDYLLTYTENAIIDFEKRPYVKTIGEKK